MADDLIGLLIILGVLISLGTLAVTAIAFVTERPALAPRRRTCLLMGLSSACNALIFHGASATFGELFAAVAALHLIAAALRPIQRRAHP